MATDDPETTPTDFADLPLQPTGSGIADMQMEQLQSALAQASVNAGIADETAGYDLAMSAADADTDADEPTPTQA